MGVAEVIRDRLRCQRQGQLLGVEELGDGDLDDIHLDDLDLDVLVAPHRPAEPDHDADSAQSLGEVVGAAAVALVHRLAGSEYDPVRRRRKGVLI
jgi:hypothetical protein